uniref:Uncharacterized protein n=1 Tax=Daphnia galeata TaxID=27404 RepID=A0A8J2RS89_9CRUS|nr:unnamed protein product [Daphnia galeata]
MTNKRMDQEVVVVMLSMNSPSFMNWNFLKSEECFSYSNTGWLLELLWDNTGPPS